MTTVKRTSVRTEVNALMPSTDTPVSVQRDTGETQELFSCSAAALMLLCSEGCNFFSKLKVQYFAM